MSDKTINKEEVEQLVSILGDTRALNILGAMLITSISRECHVHLIDSVTMNVIIGNEKLLDELAIKYDLIKGEIITWNNGIVQGTLTIKQ